MILLALERRKNYHAHSFSLNYLSCLKESTLGGEDGNELEEVNGENRGPM